MANILGSMMSSFGRAAPQAYGTYEKNVAEEEKAGKRAGYLTEIQTIMGSEDGKKAMKSMIKADPASLEKGQKDAIAAGNQEMADGIGLAIQIKKDIATGDPQKLQEIQTALTGGSATGKQQDSSSLVPQAESSILPSPETPQQSVQPSLPVPEGQVATGERQVTTKRPRIYPEYYKKATESAFTAGQEAIEGDRPGARDTSRDREQLNALQLLRSKMSLEGAASPENLHDIDLKIADKKAAISSADSAGMAFDKRKDKMIETFAKTIDPEIGEIREEKERRWKEKEAEKDRRNKLKIARAKGYYDDKKYTVQASKTILADVKDVRNDIQNEMDKAELALSRNKKSSDMRKLFKSGAPYVIVNDDGKYVRDQTWFDDKRSDLDEVNNEASRQKSVMEKVQGSEGFVSKAAPTKKSTPSWIKKK